MDVLSDVLDLLQLRGTLYFRTAFAAPFAVTVPAYGRAARFHLAVQGRCHVVIAEDEAVLLEPGDLILIPGGSPHVLCDQPDRPAAPLETVLQRAGYSGEGVLAYSEESDPTAELAAETKLICGHLDFAAGADHPLLRALPGHLLVTAEVRAQAPWIDEIMRLIVRQMFAGPPGVTASVIRLTEALFIEVIRTCSEGDPALARIFEAMNDPRIGRALSLMHRSLQQDWTLERLAREVGMSRSRFAERFQSLVGVAPMSYLAELRLQKAANLLAGSVTPIQQVAAEVGYRSPAAFTRAFANRYGKSPRAARQQTEVIE